MTGHTHEDHEKEAQELVRALSKWVLAALIFAALAAFMAGLIG